MTTATKARPKASALADLEQLESDWAEAKRTRSELGAELKAKHEEQRALFDRRQHLIHREPGLVDHLGNPLEADNVIAAIDSQLGKLGDLDDLNARYAHAQRLEEAAKQATHAHVAEHFDRIVDELRPQAEAAVAEVQAKAAALAEAADAYLGFARRVDGLRAADRQRHQVRVPAIDAGSELVRLTAGYRDASLPLPTELR